MNRSIPENISTNQQNEEQCRKFLAGNRSCFYRGFWKNAPYKEADQPEEHTVKNKTKQGKN
ncbi:MAG: hypothetical protein HN457_07040 [Opitutales bacterium]|jgi:hypothetical protein|nr:hypothetical protein [Opitutales bacterium]MBT5169970.1 hypothetical protein [Opitutales bacterium]MBT5816041.1 hypothetical protein [Opitutales bacterium]MBT6767635.1 hypothetical protein [Opitutales bacterium]MBT7866429.1 hypothetical protein [Opitutales bacterium]